VDKYTKFSKFIVKEKKISAIINGLDKKFKKSTIKSILVGSPNRKVQLFI
jgi:hypothetical protein